MNAPVRTRRKNAFNLLREAQKLMSFDDFPMARPEVDPQLHASRNEIDQPFHLVCEKDCVVAQVTGRSRLLFAGGSVRYFDLEAGDHVYVPAGSIHRILTTEPGIQVRYKARLPGRERVVWHCDACGTEICRHEFDASAAPAQLGYQAAADAYNADPKNRKCPSCGHEHPAMDFASVRWSAVAEALLQADEEE